MGRGASALAAKARAVTSLELVAGLPHLRRVRTATNLGPAPRSPLFEVCSPESTAEELLFFRPSAGSHNPRDLLDPGQCVSTNELARRLAGGSDPDQDPPGEMKKLAASLRERWREAGRGRVVEGGKGKSTTIELIASEGIRA